MKLIVMVVVKDEGRELYSPPEVCCTKDRLHEERTMVERNTERNTVVSENKRLDCMMSGHAMVDNLSKNIFVYICPERSQCFHRTIHSRVIALN